MKKAIIVLFASTVLAACPVPFIEGDEVITSGSAYEFTIGMSKTEAIEVVTNNYNEKGNHLKVLTSKMSEPVSISNGDVEELPYMQASRWDIEMPSNWVNDIYLHFEGGRLVRIQRSRWLYERP